MPDDWLRIGLVIAALGGLLLGVRAWVSRGPLDPQAGRQLLHVGAGLVALFFPWLFSNAWPVLTAMGITLLTLCGLRLSGYLHRRFADLLYAGGRRSPGDVYFFVAIALVFVLSGGDALSFAIPVLILALADPAATLVGVRYGRHRFPIMGGEKSVEGSLAFLAVAFLSTAAPLVLLGQPAASEVLVAAAIVAIATTLVEAMTPWALDNLFVPLAAHLALRLVL